MGILDNISKQQGTRDWTKALETEREAQVKAQIKQKAKAAGRYAKQSGKAVAAGAGFVGGAALGGAIAGGRRVKDGMANVNVDRGTLFLLAGFVLFIIDLGNFWGGPYTGYRFIGDLTQIFQIAMNVFMTTVFGTFFLIFFINKIIRKEFNTLAGESAAFVFFALIASYILLTNQWLTHPKATLHFLFILIFGLLYILKNEDSSTAYLYMGILLLIDFFGHNYLSQFFFFRYVPFLFIFVVFYTYMKAQNEMSVLFFILLVVLFFLFAYQDAAAFEDANSFRANTGGQTWEEFVDEISKSWTIAYNNYQDVVEGRIQYAITGKVEQNQYEPLGVYLKDVQIADPLFYEGEEVVVWGSLEAKTLDEPINIKTGCFIKDDDKRVEAKRVEPDKPFPVFTLEEQDFTCIFDACDLSNLGTSRITTYADFNFETLGYLKTYFMNDERKQTMRREGIDIFNEFEINDREPVAVYTNGPMQIAMGTSDSLIGVKDSYAASPRFTVSVSNRPQWEGKIVQLKELVLFLPSGMNIEQPETSCTKPFKEYTQQDCVSSCDMFVFQDCSNTCNSFESGSAAQARCSDRCAESKISCEEECSLLFEDEDEQYHAYSLEIDPDAPFNEFKDFQRNKFFSCSFLPSEEVLDNAPITTKFLRAKARYNYSLQDRISASVIKNPDDEDACADQATSGSGSVILVKAPTDVSVKAAENGIEILWTKSADDGAGENDVVNYRISRITELKVNQIAGEVPNGITTFTDKEADLSKKYSYQVIAIDKDQKQGKSEKVDYLPVAS